MKFSGVGWPTGAVDNATILALPGAQILMLATEGRWHYNSARMAGKQVTWRAVPRIGRRPAEVGWSPSRAVDECLNLTDAATAPISDFVPFCELDLRDERGDHEDDFSDLDRRYTLIGGFLSESIRLMRQRLPGTRIHFPPFTPDHQALDYVHHWRAAAEMADVIQIHAYDFLENIQRQYEAYRAAFPDTPIMISEWHGKGDLAEERRILQWLADLGERDPLFFGATFFIWRWWDHPGWWDDAWDIEHSPDRLALFMDPPAASTGPVEPPVIVEPPVPVEPIPVPDLKTWEHFLPAALAAATECPLANVESNWPKVHAQLVLCGIADLPVQIGVIGTIAKESASTFAPVDEAYWLPEAARWAEYIRRGYSGGPNYHGRGLTQNTHIEAYRALGPKIAALWGTDPNQPTFDLVTNPDNLLDPDMSAAAAALFFRDTRALPTPTWPAGYSLLDACRANDDEWIRRLVYGGPDPDGAARIGRIRAALTGGVVVPVPGVLAYNPETPPERQISAWACSIRTATWMLRSLGVDVDAGTMQDVMVPKYVTPELGLLLGSGVGLAEVLHSKLPGGTRVTVYENASWDAVQSWAGTGPLGMGSASLYHWLAIRARDDESALSGMNPAPGYKGVGDQITRAEFDQWAPWNVVRVAIEAPVVVVPPVLPDELAALRAENAELRRQLTEARSRLGVASVDYAQTIADVAEALRALRPTG